MHYVIFGAGNVGQLLLRELQSVDHAPSIVCFCDNNPSKKSFAGLPVLTPSAVKEKYPDAVFYISLSDIDDAVQQLQSLGFQRWVSLPHLQRTLVPTINPDKWTWDVPLDAVHHVFNSAYWCHQHYEKKDFFLHSVDIMVTARCSLRCRDCCNLMPLYRQPENFSPDTIMREVNRLLASIDALVEARVIGGEPLMNQEFHRIVEYLAAKEKIKKVVIYTNGTIPLREEQAAALQHEKVFFMITDYGTLSRSLSQQVAFLSRLHIAHWVMKAGGWTDCGKVEKHNRTLDENKKIFSLCCANNLFTLLDGRLYRCPFSANAHHMKLISESSEGGATLERSAIVALREKESLVACDYCNGRMRGSPEITPAIQLGR